VSHYGFALGMPGSILLIAAAVGWLPQAVAQRGGFALLPRLNAIAILVVVLAVHLWIMSFWLGMADVTIAAGTPDEFRADFRGRRLVALLADLQSFTKPDDTLLVMPEGLMINFLARRANPTTHLNFTPPALIMYGEQTMLADFQSHGPPDYVAIVNNDSG